MMPKTREQFKLQTASLLVRMLIKDHPNKELAARAERWLERNGLKVGPPSVEEAKKLLG